MPIQPVPMGVCTSYPIWDEGIVLVDAAQQGYGARVSARLRKPDLSPSQLIPILISHGHWHQIGAVNELRQAIKCPVAINERERKWVQKGLKPLALPVAAWGRIVEVLMRATLLPKQTSGRAPVHIPIGDDPISQEPYGVRGKAYRTAGHYSGSMSIILEDGRAGSARRPGPSESARPAQGTLRGHIRRQPVRWGAAWPAQAGRVRGARSAWRSGECLSQ